MNNNMIEKLQKKGLKVKGKLSARNLYTVASYLNMNVEEDVQLKQELDILVTQLNTTLSSAVKLAIKEFVEKYNKL